ncbi:unnamed protein product [Blepharisma stoltei]|uniref:Uncharacterized protein n=1 Tax=Blepharisma stoltei TaxID=1481888 RepID=A0AAU9K3L0_9CILI|nr:unnamed protein product [Blepharisma stoltei]
MNNADMVGTKFIISEKEKALRDKFFRSQASSTPTTKPIQKPAPEINQKYHDFLDEMQTTLKQQATGAFTGELLQKQALIMQQQVQILKAGQSDHKKIIQAITHKPNPVLSKEILAELIEPLNRQLQEVKRLYQEDQVTTKNLFSQVNEIKSVLENDEKIIEPKESVIITKKSIENIKQEKTRPGTIQKAQPKGKEEKVKNELEIINKDTKEVEKEIDGRLDRILEKVEKIKNIPMKLDSEVMPIDVKQILGEMNYDVLLEELNMYRTVKNDLIREYQSCALLYPRKKPEKAKPEEAKKRKNEKTIARKVQVPSYKTNNSSLKPKSLQNIRTKPKVIESMTKKKSIPKSKNILLVKAEKSESESPEPTDRSLQETSEPIIPSPKPLPKPETVSFPTQTSPHQSLEFLKIQHENPNPFETRPGTTTGKLTEENLSSYISPPYLPQFQTSAPLRGNLEEQTIDAITAYVLNQTLGTTQRLKLTLQENPSSLLGVEEISELVKQGLHFDPNTISNIGREIILEKVRELREEKERKNKENMSRIEENSKNEEELNAKSDNLEASIKKEESKSEYIEENSKKEEDSKVKSDYTSDFEPDEKSEHEESPKFNGIQIPAEEIDPFLFKSPKIETSPRFLTKQPSAQSSGRPSTQSQDDLVSLLNPRLLGMMSAASIQHYISSLIQAGHLSRNQTPSFLSRTETPSTQIFSNIPRNRTSAPNDISTVPQSLARISETPKLPDEVSDFFKTQVGQQFQKIIVENSSLSAHQIMEKWSSQHISTPQTYQNFNILRRIPNNINIDAEEIALKKEAEIPRRKIDISYLEDHKTDSARSDLFTLSESDESLRSSLSSEKSVAMQPEFIAGFKEFLVKSQLKELSSSSSLSEGEVRMSLGDTLSSGEIPRGSWSDAKKFKDSLSGIFSPKESSQGQV